MLAVAAVVAEALMHLVGQVGVALVRMVVVLVCLLLKSLAQTVRLTQAAAGVVVLTTTQPQ
jgi:hypothetical protein